MSPQPLTSFGDGAATIEFGFPFDKPPYRRIAADAMAFIHAWSCIDLLRTRMMTAMLHSDLRIVAAMMSAVTSAGARQAALMGALRASDNVLDEDIELIEDVWRQELLPLEKQRNKFAHHVWATSPELPGTLLLFDPAVVAMDSAESTWTLGGQWDRYVDDPGTELPCPFVGPLQLPRDRSNVMVYTAKEVGNLRPRAAAGYQVSMGLWALASGIAGAETARLILLAALPNSPAVQRRYAPSGPGTPPPRL